MDSAACRGMGTSSFFPDRGGSTAAAHEACDVCKVQAQCRTYRAKTGSVGIWGGEYTEHPTKPMPDIVPVQDARPKPVGAKPKKASARKKSPVHPTRAAARK